MCSTPRIFRGIFDPISIPRQEGIIQRDLGEKMDLRVLFNKIKDAFCEELSRTNDTRVDTDRTFEIATTAARKTRSPKVMSNRSIYHARHVLSELLELGLKLKEPIYIVCGALNDYCYNDLAKFVAQYDRLGLGINVWVTDVEPNDIDNDFATALRKSECCTLKKCSETDRDMPHFAVLGATAYRLETEHKTAKAVFSFNDPSLGDRLQNMAKSLNDG